MKLYKHILFDTSNIYLRAYHGNPNKQEAPLTASKMVTKIIRDFAGPGCNHHFLCDNWGSTPDINYTTKRKQIDPNYKGNRKHDQNIKQGLLIFQDWLKTIPNTKIHREPQKEADDLVFPVLHEITNEFALLVSSDLDWAVEMSRKVHWYNFEMVLTPLEFEKQKGFLPTRNSILLYKTFRGDKSDSIPNPGTRISEEDLLRLIKENRDLYSLIKSPPQYIRGVIKQFEDRLVKNWRLVSRID